jgi:hypothetical protein
LVAVFTINDKRISEQISVLENSELCFTTDDMLHQRVSGLIQGAGLGVGIELLRRELSQ